MDLSPESGFLGVPLAPECALDSCLRVSWGCELGLSLPTRLSTLYDHETLNARLQN